MKKTKKSLEKTAFYYKSFKCGQSSRNWWKKIFFFKKKSGNDPKVVAGLQYVNVYIFWLCSFNFVLLFYFFLLMKKWYRDKSKSDKSKGQWIKVNDKALAYGRQNGRGWRALADVSKKANHDRDAWTIPKRFGFHRRHQIRRRCQNRRGPFGRESRMAGWRASTFPAPMTVNITVFSENAWKINVIKCKLGKAENSGMINAIICKWGQETKSNVVMSMGRVVVLSYFKLI